MRMTRTTCCRIRRLLLCLFICASAVSGQPSAIASENACVPLTGREIRAVLDRMVEEGRSPALIAVVIEQGKTRFFSARAESGPEIGPDSVFEIGSCTKVFTGLLLARTETSGRACPQMTLHQAFPALEFKSEKTGRITLGRLSSHNSGLPRMPSNWMPKNTDDPYADYGPDKLMEFLAAYTPDPTQTPAYRYSNLGTGLLGFALAETEGENYSALIHDRILAPLGMHDSFAALPENTSTAIVQGHDAAGKPVPAWNFNVLAGAGGLKSTPRDMAVFLRAELDPGSTNLEKSILRSRRELGPGPAPSVTVAYGLHRLAMNEETLFMHDGGTGGHRSFMGFNPSAGRGVAVFSAASKDISDLGLHLLCSAVPLREVPKIIELDSEQLDRYTGSYILFPNNEEWRTVLHVSRYDRGLSLRAEGDLENAILAPVDEEMFIFRHRDDGAVRFEADEHGRIIRLVLLTAGEETPAQRIAPNKPAAHDDEAAAPAASGAGG